MQTSGHTLGREGADQSVIRFRRGLDARSIPAVKFRIPDLMQVASRVMEQVNSHNPGAVFIDEGVSTGWISAAGWPAVTTSSSATSGSNTPSSVA
jgi:hypothetical protein